MRPKAILEILVLGLCSLGCGGAVASERSAMLLEEYYALAGASAGVLETLPAPSRDTHESRPSISEMERSPPPGEPDSISPLGHSAARGQEASGIRPSGLPSVHSPVQRAMPADTRTGTGAGFAPRHGGFGAADPYLGVRDANVALGPLQLALSWHAALDATDNFLHTRHDRLDALSLAAGMMADGQWQLTPDQAIDLQLGLGIDHWLEGPGGGEPESGETDLNILPGSRVDYEIGVGRHITVRLYERFEIERNRGRHRFSLDPVEVADRWTNAAGADLEWEINDRLSAEAGYEFGRRRALGPGSGPSLLDYDWHAVALGIERFSKAGLGAGIEATASWADHEHPDLNDSRALSAGVYGQCMLSSYTLAFLSLGVDSWRASGSETLPSGSHTDWHGTAQISNALNDVFEHSLSFSRFSALSEFADLIRTDALRYGFEWEYAPGGRLSTHVFYQRSRELGAGRSERRTSFGAEMNVQQTLTDYLTLGLGGRHIEHRSTLSRRDYAEQRAQGWLSWDLNAALSLNASFEHWRATGDVDFHENRALLGASLSF